MKTTSKHYKVGTRIVVTLTTGPHIKGMTGVIDSADTDGFPRIIWNGPQRDRYISAKCIKRIKIKKEQE